MDDQPVVDTIMEASTALGIDLERHQAELCARHLVLLRRWNRHINLTRITDLHAMVVGHLLDSLLPARWLPDHGPALDVGSGAGFPGLPLKILKPGLDMTLLEATRKKASFLNVLLAQLGLPGLRAVQGRWEHLSVAAGTITMVTHPPGAAALARPTGSSAAISPEAAAQSPHPGFSLITMRALTLQPEHLTTLASSLLQPGGMLAWWAGPKASAAGPALDARLAGTSIRFVGYRRYTLPTMTGERSILLWTRTA